MMDVEKMWAAVNARISAGRILAAGYTVVVVVVGYLAFGAPASDVRPTAARDLGANTLLADIHLNTPPAPSLDKRQQIVAARTRLVGKYLRDDVRRDEPLGPEQVRDWPELGNTPTAPIELSAEPDLGMLNRGAEAEFSIADAHKQATVLAVIASKGKWYVLVRRTDLGDVLGKEIKLSRVMALPAPATPPPPVAAPIKPPVP